MQDLTTNNLLQKSCKHYSPEDPKLSNEDIESLLNQVIHWQISKDRNLIYKDFKFKNYYETIAFVNAVAWIVHQQNHHPEIKISYNNCHIEFSTHSIKGLSLNDFICAALINNINHNKVNN